LALLEIDYLTWKVGYWLIDKVEVGFRVRVWCGK